MSINTAMTSIADKIRSLLGLSGAMGLDAMASNLAVEQANIADAFAAVSSKGGTVPDSQVSGNLASAIGSIPLGVTVQRAIGTFTTDSNGDATVNCGFQPDVVTIPVGLQAVDGVYYELMASIDFSSATTDEEKKELCSWATDDTGLLVFVIKRKQIGFEISCATYDWSWKNSAIKNRSFDFVAIKFTQ